MGINFMYIYSLQYDSGQLRKDLCVRLVKNDYNSQWPRIWKVLQQRKNKVMKSVRKSTRTKKTSRKGNDKDVRRSRA